MEPQKFYGRKLFGAFAFYLGVFLSIITIILLLTGNMNGVRNLFLPALILTWFGHAYRKPRVIISDKEIICLPNPLREHRAISFSDLEKIEEGKSGIQFFLKDKKIVTLPKYEFTGKTREKIINSVRAAAAQKTTAATQ